MDIIEKELRQLSGSIFVLRKIAEFPFHLFIPRFSDDPFWHIVSDSLFEAIVLRMYKVTIDNGKDSLTLLKLKKYVLSHLLQKEHRQAIKNDPRLHHFQDALKHIEEHLKPLRHKQFAHLDKTWSAEHNSNQLTLLDIEKPLRSMSQMFRLLSFDFQRPISWSLYDGRLRLPSREDKRTDIEKLLDSVAKTSAMIDLPEKKPDRWKTIRRRMSATDLELLNKYREKFGMPIV